MKVTKENFEELLLKSAEQAVEIKEKGMENSLEDTKKDVKQVCSMCLGRKWMTLEQYPGCPESKVGPCLGCSGDLSLDYIQKQGGFVLIKQGGRWIELYYEKFEDKMIEYLALKTTNQSKMAAMYTMKLKYFGVKFSPSRLNKEIINKWSHNGLDKIKKQAWAFIEANDEWNREKWRVDNESPSVTDPTMA